MPCVALLLFIGWSVYFHRFPAQIVSYRWLLESGIVNIGESKIKLMFWHWNTFFSFFSSSLHSFLSRPRPSFLPLDFPHLSLPPCLFFSLWLQNINARKNWPFLVWKHHRRSSTKVTQLLIDAIFLALIILYILKYTLYN